MFDSHKKKHACNFKKLMNTITYTNFQLEDMPEKIKVFIDKNAKPGKMIDVKI
jgi:hypothetical protein